MNGGWGLGESAGIVSKQDDSYLVYKLAWFVNDFTITITVPASDEYLNIRWRGDDWNSTYLKAKMKAERGTITLDYNGTGKVATKNLYDVRTGYDTEFLKDWKDAEKRSAGGKISTCRLRCLVRSV